MYSSRSPARLPRQNPDEEAMAPRGGASLGRPGHPRLCALCPVAGRSPTRIPSPEQQGPWWPSLRADPAQPGRP